VDSNNNVTGVQATPSGSTTPQTVTPEGKVTVSYPVIANTTISLALAGTTGVGTVASIPASVTINEGESSATFPISILSNPGANTTLTFQITASLSSAIGAVEAKNATFTVTGAQPPQPIFP
jgi:hypothetical protein